MAQGPWFIGSGEREKSYVYAKYFSERSITQALPYADNQFDWRTFLDFKLKTENGAVSGYFIEVEWSKAYENNKKV